MITKTEEMSDLNSEKEFLSLDELREAIALSNFETNELVHSHEKFVGAIRKLNNEAKVRIGGEKSREGLIFLGEAEKILEYGASCGKNIDRNMIVCILHNEACCYQKLWELERCSNYIEALIFNISSHLKTSTPSPRDEDYIKISPTLPSHLRQRLYGKSFNHRVQLCKYHLQFCAINSQLRNHKSSLISGRRSISIIKDLLNQLYTLSLEKKAMGNCYRDESELTDECRADYLEKIQILTGVSSIADVPDAERAGQYETTARYYFRKWSVKKLNPVNENLKESLKNFSIGSIMQLKPLSFEDSRQSTLDPEHVIEIINEEKYQGDMLKIYTLPKVINSILLLTMGYFTIATELRLIANQKHKDNEAAKKKSQEFRESEIYHLMAIIITCIYVPYDMLYMRHLLSSFANNYNANLAGEKSKYGFEECEDNIMRKEFDCATGDDKKSQTRAKKVESSEKILKAGEKQKSINHFLAQEFAESIKMDSEMPVYLKQKSECSKDTETLEKPVCNKARKTRKFILDNPAVAHSIRNRSKPRAQSETVLKNPIVSVEFKDLKRKRVPEEVQNKPKTRSLQPKMKKSNSNSKKQNPKKTTVQKQKQPKKKCEYFKNSKGSKNSQLFKESHERHSKQAKVNVKALTSQEKSKKMLNSKVLSSYNLTKQKKGTPLKKNLDKYYF